MPSLTESFRMLEQATIGSFQQEQAVALAGCQYHAGAQAASVHFPAIELDPVFPGLEIVGKMARALARPVHPRRTAAEELAEERLNTITHGLGLAVSATAVAYLFTFVVTAGGWLQ